MRRRKDGQREIQGADSNDNNNLLYCKRVFITLLSPLLRRDYLVSPAHMVVSLDFLEICIKEFI